ncbi:tectonic-3-like isoform X3 [Hoplias malabaricus]|uniref:tectonic-3-like isoform X3 n=1 Tax=Hoplias malabaricus TaxID=27720 RepID=UPI0034635DEF
MLSHLYILHLVLALGVILPLFTDSQNTWGYTEQPPLDYDEHLFTENSSAVATALHTNDSVTVDTSDPLHTVTPSVIPRGFDVRAVSTFVPTTSDPITVSDGCACDITPNFCDIGCCCDYVDCGFANLSSVFSGCKQATRSAVCVESWLMFRANVDPQLVTVTDSFFCVRKGNDTDVVAQTLPAFSEGPFSIFSPHFSLQEPTSYSNRNTSFYKVDDFILTYYNNTSVVSVLRHPSPGVTSSCVDRNPAKFLRSASQSCSRTVSTLSCRRDGSLSVRAYSTGFRLLSVPRLSKTDLSNQMIPVILLSNQPEPTELNGSCLNVVSKLTVQGLSVGGDCSTDDFNRAPILFTHNTITGCTFRSPSHNCTSLRAQLYSILQGSEPPDMVAMTGGSQPDWSKVIIQDCPQSPHGKQCETGCLLPVSLSVKVLWAQRGLLALPQNHILGAKYVFSCQIVKCPDLSPLPVTTEVIFSDATLYPEAPRGEPQPEWKFPFAFFTRGAGELDGE